MQPVTSQLRSLSSDPEQSKAERRRTSQVSSQSRTGGKRWPRENRTPRRERFLIRISTPLIQLGLDAERTLLQPTTPPEFPAGEKFSAKARPRIRAAKCLLSDTEAAGR